jgi:hypothetical protein
MMRWHQFQATGWRGLLPKGLFSEGLALAKIGSRWGFIDKTAALVGDALEQGAVGEPLQVGHSDSIPESFGHE